MQKNYTAFEAKVYKKLVLDKRANCTHCSQIHQLHALNKQIQASGRPVTSSKTGITLKNANITYFSFHKKAK